jgi:hypothetical protein
MDVKKKPGRFGYGIVDLFLGHKFSYVTLFLILAWWVILPDKVHSFLLTDFTSGLSGWQIVAKKNLLSPSKNIVHICGDGFGDRAALSITDLRLGPEGEIFIEVPYRLNSGRIREISGYFFLRSLSGDEEFFANLYVRGKSGRIFYGPSLFYSQDKVLLYKSDQWHRLIIGSFALLDESVQAVGLHIYSPTGYGLNTNFYDKDKIYGGMTHRKFLFDFVTVSVIPEPNTFIALFLGAIIILFIAFDTEQNRKKRKSFCVHFCKLCKQFLQL